MGGRDELCGRALGEFVLRDRIGEGGFGAVYRCEQPLLGREAVIKVLHRSLRDSDVVLQRFLREARLASSLDHPYAAHVYAFGFEQDERLFWIAMELVRGTPLDRWLRDRGPLSVEQLVPFFERVAEVVQTAHEHGIVHRDLKPSNIMVIERAGRLLPKLLDFGIAKLLDSSAPAEPAVAVTPSTDKLPSETDTLPAGAASRVASPVLTQADATLGSPAYMSPEQWGDALAVGPKSDLYALGIVAYECLTGKRPFVGASLAAFADLHANADVPPLENPDLDRFFRRALAKQPEQRPASALELAAELRVAAGLTSDPSVLPRLAETLRDAWISDAPQPLAEAVAVLDGARNVHQARDAAHDLVRGLTRYLLVLALAAHAQVRGDDPQLRDLLRTIRSRELDRVSLLRSLVAPFAGRAGAHPLPELVALATSDALDRVTLRELGGSEEVARSQLAQLLPALEALLRACAFVLERPLVVARDGVAERWTGLRRHRRPIATVRDDLVEDHPTLLDGDRIALLLWPLAQVATPTAIADPELFLFDGPGRTGARLVAAPAGYERHDASLWDWLGEHVVGESAVEREDDTRPPYLGLASFTTADADRFVGREREVDAFVNLLRRSPLQVIVGASGSGKSSFVHAGVVPALGLRAVTMRPGAHPMTTFERLGDHEVLVVDQLEELFTLCHDTTERERFTAALADAKRVICTLRDDFLMDLEAMPALRARLSSALFLLGNPSRDELVRTVVEPAQRLGYELSDGELARDMAAAVVDRPGALALLSFTASRLWELRDRRFRQMTRKAYDAMGGVGGALGQHAEATLGALGAEEQRITREAFRHLVTSDGTRAVLAPDELLQKLASGRAASVIDKLVGARLLTITEAEVGAHIEITHEALIVAWPRLQQWIREDVEGARLREQLGTAARQWHERGRPRGQLWRDEALVELERWRRTVGQLSNVEAAFADASRSDARRARRIRRTIAVSAFSVLAIGIVVLLRLNHTADLNERRAHRQLAEQYEEQGRVELTTGHAGAALVHFFAAIDEGAPRDAAFDLMLAEAARPLRAQAIVARGHATGKIRWLELSPDRTRVASASDDGTVRVWDAHTGAPISVIAIGAPVGVVHFCPDGSQLLTVARDGIARVHAIDGRLLHTLHTPDAHGLVNFEYPAYSPDGTRIAAPLPDGSGLAVWDAASGQLVSELPSSKRLERVAYSPDGAHLAWSGGDLAWIRDETTGVVHELRGHADEIARIAYSPDGSLVATASWDRTARIWTSAGELRFVLQGHDDYVDFVAFDPTGTRLVTTSRDHTARLWDPKTGALLFAMRGHDGPVVDAVFDRAGQRIVTASGDGTARLWDVANGIPLLEMEGHGAQVTAGGFSADDRIVTAGADGSVRFWDPGRVRILDAARGDTMLVADSARHLVAAGNTNIVRVWDLAAQSQTVLTHPSEVTRLRFRPGGAELATAAEGVLRIWRDGRARLAIEAGALILDLAYSPDGTRIATTHLDGVARVWDAETGAPIATLTGHIGRVRAASFVDRDHLVTAGEDASVRLWTVATQTAAVLSGHTAPVRLVLVVAGVIVTGGNDNTARIWSRDGRLLHVLAGHTGPVVAAAASGDEHRIATASYDGNARIWDVATGREVTLLQGNGSAVNAVALDEHGELAVTVGTDDVVRVWDARGRVLAILFGGLAEVGWVVEYVAGGETSDTVCEPIDHALRSTLDVTKWTGDYELLHGLVGVGLYALSRLHAPTGRAVASKVLEHLEQTSLVDGSRRFWITPTALLPEWAQPMYPNGQVNLGVAHGMPGIIGFASRCIAADFEVARTRALLDGCVAYLLSAVPERRPRFPAAIVPSEPPPAPTRVAWCYGDLGIAVVLLGAARATNDAAWEREAIALGLACIDRDDHGVIDAGLCHGAAGAGHLFHRLYRATTDERFADAARMWFERTLAMRRPGEGIGGFVSPEGDAGWRRDPTLLTGAAGTALALLAAASEVDPGWDRLLLCDVSPSSSSA